MAAHLPRDSATMLAALPREELEHWDVNSYLLANVADLLAGANWQRGGGKTARPKPTQRPKPYAATTRNTGHESVADFRAWYEAQPGGRKLK